MIIRRATEADLPELTALFAHSVKAIAYQRYSNEQVEAWASFSSQTDAFNQFLLGANTFVIETAGQILGFSGVALDGHITALYVHGDYQRQGIGSSLLKTVLNYAQTHNIATLYAEASEFSKPLFEKFGFETYDTENVERNGVMFHRYLVRKNLEFRAYRP
jgi:putative acetyltransferase